MQTALHRFHARDLQMNKPVYGEGPSRVGVRQITPKIYWICHCIGKGVEHYNGGFASEFAKVNPALDPTANDIIYSSYLFLDEKTFLIDTLGPWQHETVLEALTDLLWTGASSTICGSQPHRAAARREHSRYQACPFGGRNPDRGRP